MTLLIHNSATVLATPNVWTVAGVGMTNDYQTGLPMLGDGYVTMTNGLPCITRDGSGWTNVPSASFYLRTNMALATSYTNTSSNYWQVSANVTLTTALVAGKARMELRIATELTNFCDAATALLSLAPATSPGPLGIIVPPGKVWSFNDSSTGGGNSATISGGQIISF